MLTQDDVKKMHDGVVRSLRRQWNAPRLHVDLRCSNATKPWPTEAMLVKGMLSMKAQGWLHALIGGRGAGKTQIAVDLMFSYTEEEKSAYYMTAMQFFIRMKSSFLNSEETAESIMAKLRAKKLLVIEEVSRRAQTDWENNLMFELINSRYNDKLDTLLIDNASLNDFCATLDPSIASRMKETGGIIECNWPSFR